MHIQHKQRGLFEGAEQAKVIYYSIFLYLPPLGVEDIRDESSTS